MVSESPEPPAGRLCVGRCCPTCQPSSRIGENPPYGMIGRVEETSASFEARSAPRLYPTERLGVKFPGPTRPNAKYQHKPAMSDNWGEADVMRVRSHPLLLTDAVASTITAL